MIQLPDLTSINSQIRKTAEKFLPIKVDRVFGHWNTTESGCQFREDLQRAIVEFSSQNNSRMDGDISVTAYENSNYSTEIGILIFDFESETILDANMTSCSMYGYAYSELIGLHKDKIFHPFSHQVFSEYIQPVSLDSAFNALFVNMHFDGSIFFTKVFGTGMLIDGQIRLVICSRKCNSDIEANKLILEWVRDLSIEQSTLTGVIQTISSNLELDPDQVLDQLKKIIPFSLGVFFGMEHDSMFLLATNGQTQTPFLIHIQNNEAFKNLFSGTHPICIGDIFATNPTTQILNSLFIDCTPSFYEGMRSWLWVPVKVDSDFQGCIGLAKDEKDYFNFHHAKIASIVGKQVALLMKNSDIYKMEQLAGAMQERQNLAHNLHDTVNQSLFSAGLIAEVLPHLWDLDPVEGRRSLTDMYRLIRGAQAEIRMMLVDLRPTTLLDVEFCDLLNLLAKAFMGRTNIPIEVNVNGQCALPAKVQTACYHICQEALNNIAKHSDAKKAKIFLSLERGWIDLNIIDDGRGFDRRRKGVKRLEEPFDISTRDNTHGFNPKYIPFEHYGLRMMNEQAELIGATMKIVSQPGKGTQISLQWTGKV